MYEWLLLIVLRFETGTHREPIFIMGDLPYTTEAECRKHGKTLVDWLAQDFVKAEYRCIPQLKRAEDTHESHEHRYGG